MADEKMVQISESELQVLKDAANSATKNAEAINSLQKQLNVMNSVNNDQAPGRKRIREIKDDADRTVRLRFIDGMPVVGFKNRGTEHRPLYIYEVPDPLHKGQTLLKVDIVLRDGKGTEVEETVDYKEFIEQADSVECKVVKIDRTPVILDEQGYVVKKEVDGYSTMEKDEEVDLIVTGEESNYIVSLPKQYADSFPNGKVEVNERYINI
jgi:hypothetical protein